MSNSMLLPIEVVEVRKSNGEEIVHNDYFFTVEERTRPEPYNQEIWGFLADRWGFKYHYSLPIRSTDYLDGYLDDGRRGDWHACNGGGSYNVLKIREAEMLRVLRELGYE